MAKHRTVYMNNLRENVSNLLIQTVSKPSVEKTDPLIQTVSGGLHLSHFTIKRQQYPRIRRQQNRVIARPKYDRLYVLLMRNC